MHVEVKKLEAGRAVLKQYSNGQWCVYWRPNGLACGPWMHGEVHTSYHEDEARQQYHRLIMWGLNQEV